MFDPITLLGAALIVAAAGLICSALVNEKTEAAHANGAPAVPSLPVGRLGIGFLLLALVALLSTIMPGTAFAQDSTAIDVGPAISPFIQTIAGCCSPS
ncbi:hypothetical protein [Notoacmeibacter ruber]|uniref:Uncharacterized protein n=1 Tax=Notoacmeibacter ruber TaxID=2670375 RepID=A0A3L7JF01_9HYPH|nr:hypothetical protein [Notoacmeibacter ruber]RLQ88899.1 hypothetical protein D8780_12350 [Notoacmeibacter ruber]